MRVTTDLFVAALLRRVFSAGGFAAVERRGAQEAGAIFVVVRDRMGGARLFGPAPQTSYGDGRPQDRRFSELPSVADESALGARLQREIRFDPDCWIVEIEPAGPVEALLDIAVGERG